MDAIVLSPQTIISGITPPRNGSVISHSSLETRTTSLGPQLIVTYLHAFRRHSLYQDIRSAKTWWKEEYEELLERTQKRAKTTEIKAAKPPEQRYSCCTHTTKLYLTLCNNISSHSLCKEQNTRSFFSGNCSGDKVLELTWEMSRYPLLSFCTTISETSRNSGGAGFHGKSRGGEKCVVANCYR